MRRKAGFRFFRSRGVVMYVVMFVLVMIGILAVQFHSFSRHAGALAFRFEKSEVVRHLAEAAIDEAFMRCWTASAQKGTDAFKFFLDRNMSTLSLPVTLTEKRAKEMYPNYQVECLANARIIDFKDKDKTLNKPFYGKEGVGTVEIFANVNLARSGKTVGNCTVVRHHDFKVVNMISNPAARSGVRSYVQNFLQDYVLFVRKGTEEAKTVAGSPLSTSYNNSRVQLVIEDQDSIEDSLRGKVFFGGTDIQRNSSDMPIFFNVADSNADVIASLSAPASWVINYDDCTKLIPKLADSEVKDILGAMTGIFEFQNVPVSRSSTPADTLEETAKKYVLESCPANDPKRVFQPGILQIARTKALANDFSYASKILQGALRQRFFYFVTFRFDLSQLDTSQINDQALIDNLSAKKICAPAQQNANSAQRDFCDGLTKLEQKGSPLPLISRLEEAFLLPDHLKFPKPSNGEPAFSSPDPIFAIGGGELSLNDSKFRPFGRFPLKFREVDKPNWLEYSNTYNSSAGEMNLRGIVRVISGVVELKGKGSDPLYYSGKGVIIADDGFRILSGIKKKSTASPDDFLVLFTQKSTITIDTTDEIHASLMAIGNNGRIIPQKNMKVIGGVAVDKLETLNWAPGEHSIRYDPNFKRSSEDVYQVMPAPQITFERITESSQ